MSARQREDRGADGDKRVRSHPRELVTRFALEPDQRAAAAGSADPQERIRSIERGHQTVLGDPASRRRASRNLSQ
jgi:hypothetical protein